VCGTDYHTSRGSITRTNRVRKGLRGRRVKGKVDKRHKKAEIRRGGRHGRRKGDKTKKSGEVFPVQSFSRTTGLTRFSKESERFEKKASFEGRKAKRATILGPGERTGQKYARQTKRKRTIAGRGDAGTTSTQKWGSQGEVLLESPRVMKNSRGGMRETKTSMLATEGGGE